MKTHVELTDAQRSAAIERKAENIALLSGAGCGKTYVLARRFTELLMNREDTENPLSRFVALTFTEKATLEMSLRVRKLLADRAAASEGPDRSRLFGWLQEVPAARISTIHGFCASLLRLYAIEAGIDPNFAVCADDLLTGQMTGEAAEQALLQAIEVGSQDVIEALSLLPYQQLVDHIQLLIKQRTAWQQGQYDDATMILRRWSELAETESQTAWQAYVQNQTLHQRMKQARSLPCTNADDKLAIYRQSQLAIIQELIDNPTARTTETIASLKKAPGNIGSAKAWGSREETTDARKLLVDLVKQAVKMSVYCEGLGTSDRQAAEILATLTRLAREADELYRSEKRRRGLLDFTDLLTATSQLLERSESVRRSVSGSIDQLLLDEAQDTNAYQMLLLERLVFGQAGAEDLQPGKLFVVGDAKQSIYRFRGAQVEVFEDLCRRLGPGQQEKLTISFRSSPATVAFVNHLFERLIENSYEAISANRTDCRETPAVEIILAGLPEGQKFRAERAVDAQALITAQRIDEMVQGQEKLVWDKQAKALRPVQYGDIAMLFRRMTNSLPFERRLAEMAVPYYVVAGTGFFKQQEVFDVLNALSVIDNPFDDVAFFGFLRSSMVGLDDNALMCIAEAIATPYLPSLNGTSQVPRIPGLSVAQGQALSFAVELVSDLTGRKNAIGVDEIIRLLLDRTGYEAVLLSQPRGKRMAGNVRMLAERAQTASGRHMSLTDFIAQMGEQVLQGARAEQAGVAGERDNVVKIMTIHKAKGLEFPVVVLPDLNAEMKLRNDNLIINDKWGLTLKVTDKSQGEDDTNTPLHQRLAGIDEDRRAQAENMRLMYVAATRMTDHLIFVGADWRNNDGDFQQANSFLRLMDNELKFSQTCDEGMDALAYDNGKYAAAISKRIVEEHVRHSQPSIGHKLLAHADDGEQLARDLAGQASNLPHPPLLGPVDASLGHVELPVTALSDFAKCPMLYRWRHQLRTPAPSSLSDRQISGNTTGLDAATTGSLLHRCMEILDFASPQPASELVRQSAGEMGIPQTAVDALTGQLDQMLSAFQQDSLFGQISRAKTRLPELDFTIQTASANVRGRIDLVFRDNEDRWHIVDYKSDRVQAGDTSSKAETYRLQMLCYVMATERHVGKAASDATVYFLRPAQAETVAIGPVDIDAAWQTISDLSEELVVAERSDSFTGNVSQACKLCPYCKLCEGL